MQSRKITVILNRRAGRGMDDALTARLARVFEADGIDAIIHRLDEGTGIADLVGEAVRSGHSAVAAGGGDGTVSSVASGLVGTETALGVLPLGTLNHFARTLGIPPDVEQAARAIATGELRHVDVADVNGRFFINNSSLGLYPRMVLGRDYEQRLGRSKRAAFVWAVLQVLKRHVSAPIKLVGADGTEMIRKTPLVFVGNNRYEMEGLKIGSRARLDEGILVVYVLREDRPAALLRVAIEAVVGRLRRGVEFDDLPTPAVRIEVLRQSVQVATDGEVVRLAPPLLYRIHPKALRVIAPRSAP